MAFSLFRSQSILHAFMNEPANIIYEHGCREYPHFFSEEKRPTSEVNE